MKNEKWTGPPRVPKTMVGPGFNTIMGLRGLINTLLGTDFENNH